MSDYLENFETLWSFRNHTECVLCSDVSHRSASIFSRCLDYHFDVFCDTWFARHLPEHLVFLVGSFFPAHHCMIHAVSQINHYINWPAQKERYVRFSKSIADVLQVTNEDEDLDFALKSMTLTNLPLFRSDQAYTGQESSWCHFDFRRGQYYVPSPVAFGRIHPLALQLSPDRFDQMDSDDGDWLISLSELPLEWLDFPRPILLRWVGELKYLSRARRVIYIMRLPGVLVPHNQPVDIQALDVKAP